MQWILYDGAVPISAATYAMMRDAEGSHGDNRPVQYLHNPDCSFNAPVGFLNGSVQQLQRQTFR